MEVLEIYTYDILCFLVLMSNIKKFHKFANLNVQEKKIAIV